MALKWGGGQPNKRSVREGGSPKINTVEFHNDRIYNSARNFFGGGRRERRPLHIAETIHQIPPAPPPDPIKYEWSLITVITYTNYIKINCH